MRILVKLFVIVLFFAAEETYAQDFVYTPKNPAFGGNPYNYSWLLSSAQAQNNFKEAQDNSYNRYNSDPLQSFTENLNRQILSQLSRHIVSRQFGEDALSEGTYTLGDYQIEIGDQSQGININIVDINTGSQTSISIPHF
jgi:curli production assembly/transport component CsgF